MTTVLLDGPLRAERPTATRPAQTRRRRWSMRALMLLMLPAVVVSSAGPAWAHNSLVSSDPADGATLDRVPAEVQLIFDKPVQKQFSQVVVTGPDGGEWSGSPADIVDGTVTVELRPLEQAGTYVIAYRIGSADGHPVSGEISFAVPEGTPGLSAAAATTAPTTAPTIAPTIDAGDDQATISGTVAVDSSGDRDLPWGVIIPAGLLILLAAVLAVRRQRLQQQT